MAEETVQILPEQLSQPEPEVQNSNIEDVEVEEAVCLPDGSIIPLSKYKLMLANKSKSPVASTSGVQLHADSRQSAANRTLAVSQSQHSRNRFGQHRQQPHEPFGYILFPSPVHRTSSNYILPPSVTASHMQTLIDRCPVSDNQYPDLIRIFIIMQSGERKLCSLRGESLLEDVLKQVGVPFEEDTIIDCKETSYPGLHYIASVGMYLDDCVQEETTDDDEDTILSMEDTMEVQTTLPQS